MTEKNEISGMFSAAKTFADVLNSKIYCRSDAYLAEELKEEYRGAEEKL